jgi:hypothetical protein
MYLVALILTTLAIGGFCANNSHPSKSLEEPVFGIEFAMENIMISVALPDRPVEGLATVKGDIAYRNLMESYLELCLSTHYTQTPP